MAMKEILFFFLSVFASTTAQYPDPPYKMLVTEITGQFISKDSRGRQEEQVRIDVYPVDNIADLNSDFVLYFEEWIGGKLNRQRVLALTGQGDMFEIQQYFFKYPESFLPGKFSISSLASLTLDDLYTKPDCNIYGQRTGYKSFMAIWAECVPNDTKQLVVSLNCTSWEYYLDTGVGYSLSDSLVKNQSFPVPASIMPDYDTYKAVCQY